MNLGKNWLVQKQKWRYKEGLEMGSPIVLEKSTASRPELYSKKFYRGFK